MKATTTPKGTATMHTYTTATNGRRLAVIDETGTELKTFGAKGAAVAHLDYEGVAVVNRHKGTVVATTEPSTAGFIDGPVDALLAALNKPAPKALANSEYNLTLTVRKQSKNACPVCGSVNRQSNGQCACRNVLYRALAPFRGDVALHTQATATYDSCIKQGLAPRLAIAEMRATHPATAPVGRVKKA